MSGLCNFVKRALGFTVAWLPVAIQSAEIDWAPYDGWIQNGAAGSIAFKSGRIDIRVSGDRILTKGWVVNPFATTSAAYENIDSATHHVLEIRPEIAHTDWSIEFDLVGATLTRDDVFTAGQLAIASTGVRLTELTLTAYAPDDKTVLDLKSLAFEQHALLSPNFDAKLAWDPRRGSLAPQPEGVSKNSGWAFFSPGEIEIGKIVIAADATGGPDAVNFSFGTTRGLSDDGIPHLAIQPATGKFLTSQTFDLLLVLGQVRSAVVGGRVTLDGKDVTPAVVACVKPGRLDGEDPYFRCPGVSAKTLGPGPHTLDVQVELEDGTRLRDSVVWTVIQANEI